MSGQLKLFLLAGALMLSCGATFNYWTVDEVKNAKVTDKDRIVDPSVDEGTSSRYMIYTDKEVFENTDDMFHWKFNSADFYGEIQEDSVYNFKVNKWRIPIFSMNRNILSFEKVPQPGN